jgi:hypothetical protein
MYRPYPATTGYVLVCKYIPETLKVKKIMKTGLII